MKRISVLLLAALYASSDSQPGCVTFYRDASLGPVRVAAICGVVEIVGEVSK